jgi:hypothetical protein
MDKLSIQNEMAQFDRKNRGFYDELDEQERKKFSPYLMIRWGSAVQGGADLQEFYLVATNERLNKRFFELSRLPKLQWLCATTVSPGMGTHRHPWIAPKKKDGNSRSDAKKVLMDLMPAAKIDDIETLAKLITREELREYVKQHGHQD